MSENIIIGSGGFALEMKNLLDSNNLSINKYISLSENKNLGLEYLGDDSVLDNLKLSDYNFYLCIGDIYLRKKYISKYPDLKFSSFVHNKSSIFNVLLNRGSIIYPNCTIFSSKIGEFSLINSNVSFSHDVQVGNFCNINPGCNIGGNVSIGDNVFIGIGATIRDNIKIGENSIIGAHTNITKDVKSDTLVYGNPGREIS